MDNSFYNIFDAFDEAVVVCQGGNVIYANASASGLLGEGICGRSSESIFGALSLANGARSGSIKTRLGVCTVTVTDHGEAQIYKLSSPASDDNLVNLADSFSASLRSAAAQQRFASEIIRQYTGGIDEPQFVDCMAIHEHNNYRIAKDAENIAFLGSAGSFFDSVSSFDALSAVKDLIDSLPAFLPNRRVELVSATGQPLRVKGDASAFERILLNLLSNALKYSPEDSTVTVSLVLSGERVRLSVQDTGRGIEQERLNNIFSAWRLPRPLSDSKAGLGLGLHVVHSLAQRFGGTVVIESKIGIGTKVTVDLPASHEMTLRDSRAGYISRDSRILTDLSDVLTADSYKAHFLD